MQAYEKLLLENKAWAAEQQTSDPEFFKRLAAQQTPKFLWIGCADSRVPADKITGTEPGEIFVHRNIANLVVNTDINMLSVLQYAVEVLGVEHVIVCGHYGCGGVKAAMQNHHYGIINHWLKEIKDTYRHQRDVVDVLPTEEERVNKMVELNVIEQVFNLAKTSIIQQAWKKNKRPQLHGWVYGLTDGIIKPVCEMDAESKIDPLYEYDNL
ncbi:carbonate dehydratase [Ferruginibacter sp. HRS2-29]|uniref:carbonate dehydratase n=1 Tax=Ferruginibacter sp. HRS2-29 TaxID=2487334 RepID=UPI0020CCEAF1|nr:carbonate dehydratase [Ferruginibacter sp. HRS2-29]MCP9752931.1 carbonate dehydratase [Ferruginibacter sp. HRS2-29]